MGSLEEAGESNSDTNMQQFRWVEDDSQLFCELLGTCEPVSGKKYTMYHGTSRRSAQAILASGFQRSTKGMLGRGVYVSRDLQKASAYPISHPESDRVVIKVVVNVGKVIAIRYQGHPYQKTWHDHGYDTAWVPPKCGMVPSGLEEDCVWDPRRIKIICTISPRPAQSSSSPGAWGGLLMPYQHRSTFPPPLMDSWSGMAPNSMFSSGGGIRASRGTAVMTEEKNGVVKSTRQTFAWEESDNGIRKASFSQSVTVTSYGCPRKKK